jgi:hypothetical protein
MRFFEKNKMVEIGNIIDSIIDTRKYEGCTDLCKIMKKCGSDKGLGWHNYTTLYDPLMSHLKQGDCVNIFELGIGTNNPDLPSSMGVNGTPGASLRGWSEWLPNANVVGADIDENIMFSTDKIMTFPVDQRNLTSINNMWQQPRLCDTYFEVIIDDGLHSFEANNIFLTCSHHKLKENGIYIVEDILPNELHHFEKAVPEYLKWFKDARIVKLPNPVNTSNDNNLLVLSK